MNRSGLKFHPPAPLLQFDGERYATGSHGARVRELHHRYLFALRYCVDKEVLVAASGEGYGSFLLGQVARHVTGVDADPKAVDFGNQTYISERVSFRRSDAAKLPIDNASVDVVVSFKTMERFADHADFISEIDRVLRPDGLLIMSAPARAFLSDIQAGQNPFLAREAGKKEFADLLRHRFPHMRLLEQGMVQGSVIMPLPEEQAGNEGQLFERLPGMPDAPYFIALAGRAPVPKPSQSIFQSNRLPQENQESANVEASPQAAPATRADANEIAVRREREMISPQDRHFEHMQAAMKGLRAQLALRDQEATKRHFEAVESELLGAKRQEECVRRLALTKASRVPDLPREFRGFGRLSRKQRLLAHDYRLVASSPLFDSNWYLKTNPDVAAMHWDPVTHYLRNGAAEGRRPGPLFDGQSYALANPDVAAAKVNPLLHLIRNGALENRPLAPPQLAFLPDESLWYGANQDQPDIDAGFLLPFYAAAGQAGHPVSVWRDLRGKGGAVPPATREEAEKMATAVRANPDFDAEFYSRRLPENIDPALHYAVVGEILGWAPSETFDPQFYLARYPDIKPSKVSPLLHFQQHGKIEGRRGAPSARRLNFVPLRDERRPVLVICHEASRTGAPILGWNLIRDLRKKHPVVTLLMHGGILEEEFAAASDGVVGPLTAEEWHPAEAAIVAERLVQAYRPLYAVSNSVVTAPLAPPLAALGVPVVALVHEFAAYTRPLDWMRSVLDWATHIVFPAEIVAESSFENFPGFEERRGIHVLAQGRQMLPLTKNAGEEDEGDIGEAMRSADEQDAFIVLGAGYVHIRKGVDLFLSVAAAARRIAPDIRFKFIWVGDGYDPEKDSSYSVYLRAQIHKSGLQDTVVFLEPVAEFEPAYRAADVFLMSSRLDPQPNVGIDALTLGLPTVCFEGACGTGEVLARDPETRSLVVPHLDTEAAAREICRLANDPEARKALSQAVARVARSAFNGEVYATQIDAWGMDAAAALSQGDLEALRSCGVVDPDLALPPQARLPASASAEHVALLQSTVVGTSPNQHRNAYFRRAIPGFHPQAYAVAHADACGLGGENPTAHWLRHGRPEGQWSHPVFSPRNMVSQPSGTLRVALHAHFHYPDLAANLAARLAANLTFCDLFVSTDTEEKAEALSRAFGKHCGLVKIRVMPNLGRDIGPLLTGFREAVESGEYDLWGHIHGKKSAWSDAGIGDSYRDFLWDNLIGGEYRMLDMAVAAFESDPKLGLVFAEDPHLVGWDGNRQHAEALAERMGILRKLPEFFDFPLGTMFWFRPPALRRLFALGLRWDDYPTEPLPYDGSLLHALERIVPFVTASESYGLASLRAPHSNW